MPIRADVIRKTFVFSFKARTSRGPMQNKTSWFIRLRDDARPAVRGIGECGPLPGLSPEAGDSFEPALAAVVARIDGRPTIAPEDIDEIVGPGFPSITFALETAVLDLLNGGRRVIFETPFLSGSPLPINGLIWMGDLDFTMNQINQKVVQGYRCIKMKVGGLDFERECDVLQYIRKRYFREDIELRVDANGAFKLDDALYKLNELARFNLHSIEQPIKPGLPEMEELCRRSPVPVAFDEELIGVAGRGEKERLLDRLKPAYIVLKPTLHGGFRSCEEWIDVAGKRGIGWWITSALESNIGLNAICQFTARFEVRMPQGLGTGMIYNNNVPSPLVAESGVIRYAPGGEWGDL